MRRVDGGWEVRLTDLPVDRLEYLLDVDGDAAARPEQPARVPGAFGDHSWLAAARRTASPGVARRSSRSPASARRSPLSRTPVGRIDVEIWAPADAAADEPLPLLISHDGPEMDAYGGADPRTSAR